MRLAPLGRGRRLVGVCVLVFSFLLEDVREARGFVLPSRLSTQSAGSSQERASRVSWARGRGRGEGQSGLRAEAGTVTQSETKPKKAVPVDEDGGYDPERIRNFAIVAHIDHGKSTLADRMLEFTKTVTAREMQDQLLDNMDIERERGITIKLQAARMNYKASDGKTYVINLIDTPGHVDFSYEVSRSLAACEGALLVVDASQGVQAQTLANAFLAIENDLEMIPVLNKIDMIAADPERVSSEVEDVIGVDCSEAIHASAKKGIGIEEILEAIVKKIPSPAARGSADKPLRALIFDSYYDSYKGVIVFFRVLDGEMRKNDPIAFFQAGKEHQVQELGFCVPKQISADVIRAGEVGWMSCGVKSVEEAKPGDTIVNAEDFKKGKVEALPGYEESKPMVWCGIFPADSDDYLDLKDAIAKLKLNDASLVFENDQSPAMGLGFRCGFLGLLHMDVVQERLSREYGLSLVITAPSVEYRMKWKNGEEQLIESPDKWPLQDEIPKVECFMEPYVRLEVFTPEEYVGDVMNLCLNRRGVLVDTKYLGVGRTNVVYELPLSEVIIDFFDQLKSKTRGYASMEYQVLDWRPNDLVKIDIKINGELAPPLSFICHKQMAHDRGKEITEKLKDLIPRQQFKVPIQACQGVKPIASSHISPVRKDVTAKCYGGDISRKKKLLQKQAKGKKKLKEYGSVEVPQEAFLAVLNKKQDKKDDKK